MLSPPTIVITEAQIAAVIRLTIPKDQIQELMGPAIAEVIETVTSQGIGPVGPMYSYHFKLSPDQFDFEVGFPVSAPVTPTGRVKPGELPAANAVRTIYTGPYEGLGEAWGEFKDQIEEAGHSIAENFWERYLSDPQVESDPAAYRTELNCQLA